MILKSKSLNQESISSPFFGNSTYYTELLKIGLIKS